MAGLKIGLAVGLMAALPGCAGWNTWPPVDPGDSIPTRDDAAVSQTMTAALARVIADYPPRGSQNQTVAINLPEPLVGQAVYRRVARDVEREISGDRVVKPLDEASMGLPIYHVAGVRIRTNRAEIDILRPVFGAGDLERSELTNDQAYEGYTVRLSGGFRPWHVTWVERFTPGIISAPALNPIDRPAPPEAEPMPEPEAEEPTAEQPEEAPAEDPGDEPAEEPGQG